MHSHRKQAELDHYFSSLGHPQSNPLAMMDNMPALSTSELDLVFTSTAPGYSTHYHPATSPVGLPSYHAVPSVQTFPGSDGPAQPSFARAQHSSAATAGSFGPSSSFRRQSPPCTCPQPAHTGTPAMAETASLLRSNGHPALGHDQPTSGLALAIPSGCHVSGAANAAGNRSREHAAGLGQLTERQSQSYQASIGGFMSDSGNMAFQAQQNISGVPTPICTCPPSAHVNTQGIGWTDVDGFHHLSGQSIGQHPFPTSFVSSNSHVVPVSPASATAHSPSSNVSFFSAQNFMSTQQESPTYQAAGAYASEPSKAAVAPDPSDQCNVGGRRQSSTGPVRHHNKSKPIKGSKVAIPKVPYEPPAKIKKYCPHCNDIPEGFRGQHEVQRHIERVHLTEVRKWVCVDASEDGKFLAHCKHCRGGKKYGAYYNAAAHLRRAHFNPRPKGRGRGCKAEEKRGGKGGGDYPPMEELKAWMKEVFVPAESPVALSASPDPDDERDLDEDFDYDDMDTTAGTGTATSGSPTISNRGPQTPDQDNAFFANHDHRRASHPTVETTFLSPNDAYNMTSNYQYLSRSAPAAYNSPDQASQHYDWSAGSAWGSNDMMMDYEGSSKQDLGTSDFDFSSQTQFGDFSFNVPVCSGDNDLTNMIQWFS